MNADHFLIKDFVDSNKMGRALAIVLVILAHLKFADPFWAKLGPFTSAGKLGVSIFVFYSGLLNELQARKKGSDFNVPKWLVRRLVRIYPTFWIGLFLTIIIGSFLRGQNYSFSTVMANIVGVHLLIKQEIITSGFARPYWFISFIIVSYVLFIGLRNVVRKKYLVIGSTAFSLLMIYLGQGSFLDQVEYYLAFLAFPMIFWGMWIMDRFLNGGNIPGNKITHWILAILLFLVSAFIYKCSRLMHISDVYVKMAGLISLNFTTIYLSCCIMYCFQWLRCHSISLMRFLNWIGSISFAIYCLHEPLLVLVERSGRLGYPVVGFLFYTILLLVVSAALNTLSKRIMTFFGSQAIVLKN